MKLLISSLHFISLLSKSSSAAAFITLHSRSNNLFMFSKSLSLPTTTTHHNNYHHLHRWPRLRLWSVLWGIGSDDDINDSDDGRRGGAASSLADSYAVRTHRHSTANDNDNELRWDFIPINYFTDLEKKQQSANGVGTLALKALDICASTQQKDVVTVQHSLQCKWVRSPDSTTSDCWSINVDINNEDSNNGFSRELECILSRIMVQCAITQIITTATATRNSIDIERKEEGGDKHAILLHVTLPLPEGQGCQQIITLLTKDKKKENYCNECIIRHLFNPLNSDYAQNMELVDMVNNQGEVLGGLPRPYVHTWNILHRGVGILVTKGKGNNNTVDNNKNRRNYLGAPPPDVYVHQRTSTKRVFPSLHDMFVGGVSCSGEDPIWTAAREVAEELGLKRALRVLERQQQHKQQQVGDITPSSYYPSFDNINPLSDKLFQCTICTSYNRCVVSMFTYACDTSSEKIEWQEEEVAWGGWVPYDVVTVAASLSVNKLKEKGDWPGAGVDDDNDNDMLWYSHTNKDECEALGNNIEEQKEKSWESWDFVPDGLLVWVAWLEWVQTGK